MELDWIYLRRLADRYERLARRPDAVEQGAFLRAMAESYLALAEGAAPRPLRAPLLGREALPHYTPAICETPESLSNNNAIRA